MMMSPPISVSDPGGPNDGAEDPTRRPSEAAADELYHCSDFDSVSLGGDLELVYSMTSRSTRISPRLLVDFSRGCRAWKSLDEHSCDLLPQLQMPQPLGPSHIRLLLSDAVATG